MNLPIDFLTLSQRIGANPLLVQGPGGNTSWKNDGVMWIKASGTLLADAVDTDIFVAVDPSKALLELDGAGDGSCRSALVDPTGKLRPSIETTFHAMLPQSYVFHFHSINTICHAIAVEGRAAISQKLEGLNWVSAPYRKPGIPLSCAIRDSIGFADVNVVVLENHGVIVAGDTIEEVDHLINDVERRLDLTPAFEVSGETIGTTFDGWQEVPEVAPLVHDTIMHQRAIGGTYYPDHVVFLGPALPAVSAEQLSATEIDEFPVPVVLVKGEGVYIKSSASSAHRAMLDCVYDVLSRIPPDWNLVPIGEAAEAELLNWDAEKYRQMLAKGGQ